MDAKTYLTRKIATAVLCVAVFGLSALRAQAQTGSALYKTKCAACHGVDGSTGKTGDLASADAQKLSDDELSGIISNGKGKMPAYGKSLKADQIKSLVAYVRGLAKK
jgi:mono/diheme cytochrome c family protein